MTQTERPLSHVLALSGHDGVGKTSLARAVAGLTGGVVICLADPLKAMAAAHLNIPESKLRDKPTPDHLRAYMRALGWAMRVEHGEDYWLKLWMQRVQASGAGTVIVDDVRHLNEAQFMIDSGAALVALKRKGTDPKRTPDLPPIIEEVFEIRLRADFGFYGKRGKVLNLDGLSPSRAADILVPFKLPPRR